MKLKFLPIMSLFSTPKDLCKEELKEFTGHKDEVNCVSYSSDFQFMVTGSDDERVRVFNVRTKKCVIKLKGHEGAIKCVAVSQCDKYFASGSYDKTARIWRTATGECVHVLEGHSKSVEAVAFSPSAFYLCTGSWDRTAILWSVQAGCLLKKFVGHVHVVQSVAFSHDFKMLATGSWDFTVRVWKLNHGSYRQIIQSYLKTKHSENQNEDCDSAAEDKENMMQQVDLSDLVEGQEDDRDLEEVKILKGHKGNVHAVCFSSIGMLASGSWDKSVRLWNPWNGWCLRLFVGHEGWVQAVNFSHDSSYVASAANDDSVKVWDIPSGKCINTFEGSTDMAQHCAFTSEGMLIASGAAVTQKMSSLEKRKLEEAQAVLEQERAQTSLQ